MNRSVVLGLGILLMAVAIGCSSKSEEDKLMEEMLANQEKMITLITKQDEASKAEMSKLKERMGEIGKKLDALPKEKQEELKKKWKPKIDAAEERAKKAVLDALKSGKPPAP
jgi:peptidoglycan hydrolase CwlO-like protein